jgi:hypothetical protein
MTDVVKDKAVSTLVEEMLSAQFSVFEKRAERDKAEARLTEAINVYNGCCKRLDKAMAALRAEAPEQTYWKNVAGVNGGDHDK